MKSRIASLALLFLAALTVLAANDAPNVVNYQGKLLNSASANVTDGTYTIQFKIYNSASGANSLWGESHTIVVSSGYFNVMLGEGGTAISGSTYTNVTDALGSTTTPYLGLTITADGSGAVNNPSEITPRLRFLSSPYALIAAKTKYADTASQATNAQTLGGLDSTKFLQPLNTASTTLNGPLNMTSASLSSSLTVSGTATLNGNVNVAGALSAATTTGGGFVPVGGIIMWSGSSTGLPDGWALCNGSGTYVVNGTTTTIPNLQDKFIVGAGSAYAPKATGGATTATLTTGNLPDFRVKFKDTYFTEAGAANPPSGDNGPDGLGGGYDTLTAHSWYGSHSTDSDNYYFSYVYRYSSYWKSTTTSPSGTPDAVSITPPYYALAFIIRTK